MFGINSRRDTEEKHTSYKAWKTNRNALHSHTTKPPKHQGSPMLLTVNLSDMSTTLYTNSDVNTSKALLTQKQKRFQQLKHNDTPLGRSRTLSWLKALINMMKCCICSSRSETQVKHLKGQSYLVLQCGRLDHLKGSAIDFNKPITPLTVGNSGGGFLLLQWKQK